MNQLNHGHVMSDARTTPAEHIDGLLLSAVMETTHEHLLVADHNGRILRASPSCGAVYGTTAQAMCATTVTELERSGVLSPSVTLKVLASKRPERLMQTTPTGRRVLAEGYPVFVEGRLVRVISRSRDATDLRHLQEEYASVARHRARPVVEDDKPADSEATHSACSAIMRDAMAVLERVADTDATIMLLGETGVGKTRIARQVHDWSTRRDKPFIDVNCSAIPESLFESEMFGCLPGAFSGAPAGGRAGLMEQAEGGTLLLDEVGELALPLQAKLLKVLQDGRVTRLGDTRHRQLDIRLIVATNKDLATLVETGRFRRDLFYRLNVVPVSLPPLRARPEEIPALVEQHMQRLNARYGETRVIDEALWGEIMRHDWPGNVRELENYLERQWLTGHNLMGRVGEPHIRPEHDDHWSGEDTPGTAARTLAAMLAETERTCLQHAMEGARSTYHIASRLGISQPSVIRKLRRHGLTFAKQQ